MPAAAPAAPVRVGPEPPRDRFPFLDGAAGHLGGALVPLAGRPDAVPGRHLVEPGGIEVILAPLRRATPGVPDRVLLSNWSRYLFLLIVPPVVLTLLLSHRRLPLRPEGMGVAVNDAGLPVAVGLAHAGVPTPAPTELHDRLSPFFHDFLGPVVEGLAAGVRLAPRVFWGNVAHYLDWVGRNLDDVVPQDLVAGFAEAMGRQDWPDGQRNPIHGLIRRAPGSEVPRRAVCCFLHHLPGRNPCQGCPVRMRCRTERPEHPPSVPVHQCAALPSLRHGEVRRHSGPARDAHGRPGCDGDGMTNIQAAHDVRPGAPAILPARSARPIVAAMPQSDQLNRPGIREPLVDNDNLSQIGLEDGVVPLQPSECERQR